MSVAFIAIPGMFLDLRVHSGGVRDDVRLGCRDTGFGGVYGNGVVLCNLFRFQRVDIRCVDGDTGICPDRPCSLPRCSR